MLDGSALLSLPVANTTRPLLVVMKGRYSAAMAAVAAGLVQYSPPQELFMIFTPSAIRSWCTVASPSAPSTWLPLPVPSSTGALSAMMRADTICAPGATPPGQSPYAAPAASDATVVP
jgi:hypothetical protein